MSLSSALSISGTGISAIESQLALISQNVANASTPNYATEVAATADVTAGGQGMGVVQMPSSRTLDSSLQASVLTQNATVAAAQTTANALSAVNATQGAATTSPACSAMSPTPSPRSPTTRPAAPTSRRW